MNAISISLVMAVSPIWLNRPRLSRVSRRACRPTMRAGSVRADGLQYVPAAFHFHMMPLPVVETDRKDVLKTVEAHPRQVAESCPPEKNDKGRRIGIAGHMLS